MNRPLLAKEVAEIYQSSCGLGPVGEGADYSTLNLDVAELCVIEPKEHIDRAINGPLLRKWKKLDREYITTTNMISNKNDKQ